MTRTTHFGLDLGTTKVCGVVGRVSGQFLECLGVVMVPAEGLREGMVADIPAVASAIREVGARLERTIGTEVGPAWVGVSGSQLASLNVRSGVAVARPSHEVTYADIERALVSVEREVVMPPDREIVHSLPRAFRVDGLAGIANPIGLAGQRLEVEAHVVTVASAPLQNVERAVEAANVEIAEIVAQPIATGRAVLTRDETDLGVAVLDIGGGTTDIAVFQEGSVCFTAAVPMAGSHITRDLAIGLRIPMAEAERVKLDHGMARPTQVAADEVGTVRAAGTGGPQTVPRREAASIIQARVEELLELADQKLRDAESRPRFPAGVVLTGGTALLPGILELAEQQFALPARLGTPRTAGPFGAAVDSPIYATAVGLVSFADYAHGEARARRNHGVHSALRTLRDWWRAVVPWSR